MGKRQRMAATEEWQQLELLVTSPEQRTYELIRPVVLFGHSPAERAQQTGAAERTIYRQVDRFVADGMQSLFPIEEAPVAARLPPAVRSMIRDLKVEHTHLNLREIATICYARLAYRPSHKTVKRVLAEHPLPPRTNRRFPLFHDTPDPITRRITIIRLHMEGWNRKSIADYLETSRETVHATIRRWATEGFKGLPNKSRAPHRPRRVATFHVITIVRRLQRNPGLGAFRMHAALRRLGIRVSPRTCSRILALNRDLYQLARPAPIKVTPQPMPFHATRRHQFWSVDVRYLDMHQLGGGQIYCISVLDNYSRAMLASALSRRQDASAYLMVLFAAIHQHGCPETVVSDHGSIFRAKQVLHIYESLGIKQAHIHKRQPWQNYIETAFNVQRRMADWHFRQATTWADLLESHDLWFAAYNHQVHWAHRDRQDHRHTPAAVLAWVRGKWYPAEVLHHIFYGTRFGRHLNTWGYIRFRHWRVYGEHGLAGERVAVWLYGEYLTIAFANKVLAQYTVTYEADNKHLRTVEQPHLFTTAYQSRQLSLWQFGDDNWRKVMYLMPTTMRKRRYPPPMVQTHLPMEGIASADMVVEEPHANQAPC